MATQKSDSSPTKPCVLIAGSAIINFGNAITVSVGPEQQPFIIHKDLAIAKSEFFRAAFHGDWTEAQTGKISLKETEPEDFKVFAHWLYDGVLQYNVDIETRRWFGDLADLWILGDQLRSPLFQNCVMDSLILVFPQVNLLGSWDHMSRVYRNTVPGAALRRFAAASYAYSADLKLAFLLNNKDKIPRDFLIDIAQISLRGWSGGTARKIALAPFATDECDYHVKFGPDKTCCNKPLPVRYNPFASDSE